MYIISEKITFSRMVESTCGVDLTCAISCKAGNPRYLKKSAEYSNVNAKNPQFDFKFDSFVKKLHPSLKKLRWIYVRESIIQEAGIPCLATKNIFLKMYGTQRNQSEFVQFI